MPVRLLFVDDEPGIRETFPAILGKHGFDVTPAATVAQALAEVTSHPFDVLVADLNIGQPGDGFTVVSAMRRTQPDCVTFILTGYPALETALEAIRSQVDDYLIKPANIPELVEAIEGKLKHRTQQRIRATQRLSDVLRDNVSAIVERTVQQMKSYPRLGASVLPDGGWADAFPGLIENLATQLDSGEPTGAPEQVLQAAAASGATRRSNGEFCAARCSSGCDVVTLMEALRLLERSIFDVVHENLFSINLSYLMSDLKRLNNSLGLHLEEIVAAFLGPDQYAA
jgi:ActR/RegA family two-component response regulator